MSMIAVSAPRGHRVAGTDVQQAQEALAERFTAVTPWLYGSADGFRFELAGTETDLFGVGRMVHTMRTRAWLEPFGAVVVMRPVAGRLSLVSENSQVSSTAPDTVLAEPESAEFAHWDALEMEFVRLDMDATRRFAAELVGLAPEAIRFHLSRPLSPAHDRYWSSVVQHVTTHVLGDPEVGAEPLVRSETFRMLATCLISTFPNPALDALTGPSGSETARPTPRSLRRAVDHMEAHADQSIAIGDVAAASGLSVRGLQHAFRSNFGVTPLEHLRTLRMERAHQELLAADPSRGDTVAAVAARWGFANAGRFSGEYLRRYGHHPSETLRS